MGLFSRYSQDGSPADAPQPSAAQVAPTSDAATQATGKGRPTPTRAEAEAARMAALHPQLTKRQLRAQEAEARALRQQKALAQADAEPRKVLLRNFVDARWSLAEFSWPVLLLAFAGLLVGGRFPTLSLLSGLLLYGFMLVCIVNMVIFWRRFRRELAERYPEASTKGLMFMMVSRMVAMRRFRQPGPAIERGASY